MLAALRCRPAHGTQSDSWLDLRHAFGRRLPAAGVSFEDRQGLPGQRLMWVTTDYGGAELRNLPNAANV